jgi:hypothetical protein
MSDTFLPAIEKPQGLMIKLAFYFTRRQFGRVLTPLKVHSARLPPAFGMFYRRVSKLDGKLATAYARAREEPAPFLRIALLRPFHHAASLSGRVVAGASF